MDNCEKDCTNCKYAVMSDRVDVERCWCSNLEINIFNPKPFYCSDWKSGKVEHWTSNEWVK